MGENGDFVREPITANSALEWALFDIIPRPVREALASASVEYSMVQITEAFVQAKQNIYSQTFRQPSDWEAWKDVLWMIGENERVNREWERNVYSVELPAQFAEEKRRRLEQVFLKNSSPS